MDGIEKIYYQLTNVDLDQQRRIWDDRGKGYYGEYRVFKELFLKVNGNSKFLMNLHIPTKNGKTTEIDLLMIHETGIYVFEIKHYKGTIYGNTSDKVWTQYFRTTENHTFENPVYQNAYHIRALETLFPSIPLYSVIVFSNDDCNVKVDNDNPFLIVTPLASMMQNLWSCFGKQKTIFDLTTINEVFNQLKIYSSIQNSTVSIDADKIVPFYDYIHQLKAYMDERISDAKSNFEKATDQANTREQELVKKNRYRKLRWWISLCAIALCCVIISGMVCFSYNTICNEKIMLAQNELQAMQQKFQHVDAFNDGNLQLLDNLIQVSDIKLTMSRDLKNTAVFSCTLTNTGEEYGIILNEDTKYIIMMNDGTVREYDMYGERLKFSSTSNRLSGNADKRTWKHSGSLKDLEIYNIERVSDIEYIKITNISIWKLYENNNNPLVNGLELKLYSK